MTRSVMSAFGTSTCSACAPGRLPITAPWPKVRRFTQCWYSQRMQKKHVPQALWKQLSTRSPTATRSTSSPTASTVPTSSWPSTKPGSMITRPW